MMEKKLQNKIDKLPKWAQEHIKSLEIRSSIAESELKKRIAELSGETKSNIFLMLSYGEKDLPLPKDNNIRFVLENGDSVDCYVRENEIRVYTTGTLYIKPQADNSICITTLDALKG